MTEHEHSPLAVDIEFCNLTPKKRVATGLSGRPLSSKQYEQLKRVMKLFASRKDAPGVYMQGLLAKLTIFFASSSTMETMNASVSCIPDINKQQPNSLHPGSS